MKHTNREAWLKAAVKALTPMFAQTALTMPATVLVSVGFPKAARGSKSGHAIGQCWNTVSSDNVNQLFISPVLSDPVRVLDVLLHEMIHAADDCKSGHKGAFTRTARKLGLAGVPTATFAGPELEVKLAKIAKRLGEYPHKGLRSATQIGKQGTRMLKVECPDDGYTVRMTRKWIDTMGEPTCPCGTVMQEC